MSDLERANRLWADGQRQAAFDALCRHYDLEIGKTVLTYNGYIGVLTEILNYYEGKKPWARVRLTAESKPNRVGYMHFYHGWEKV